jgi:hypothetical protein
MGLLPWCRESPSDTGTWHMGGPTVPTEVMKSQYERIADGVVDFPHLKDAFYVTDTNYMKAKDVQGREPNARLVRRFVKPNGVDSIDVYRLH